LRAIIIAQIERFVTGFRDRILACATHTSMEVERYNPNYIGGDINGGMHGHVWLLRSEGGYDEIQLGLHQRQLSHSD
jgi:phytoene dehydrogenase-like protein